MGYGLSGTGLAEEEAHQHRRDMAGHGGLPAATLAAVQDQLLTTSEEAAAKDLNDNGSR